MAKYKEMPRSGLSKYLVIDGHRFERDQGHFTKRGALSRAKELRSLGYFARTLAGTTGAYAYITYRRSRRD